MTNGAPTTTYARFSCTFTTGGTIGASGTPYIYISKGTNTAVRTIYIDGVQLEASATASNYTEGNINLDGQVMLKNSANSTTALQIQNSSGTSLLTADTVNMKLEVNGDLYAKGIAWSSRTTPSDAWNAVAYGNGLFVAVAAGGSNGRIATSPDGINWVSRAAPGSSAWERVAYGNGLFVAVADGGTNRVMTSSDGVNWTIRPTTVADSNTWWGLTYGSGLFVAVSLDGFVMTSPDGINWTSRTAPNAFAWTSVAYGNGIFAAVAWSGTGNRVMTSPDGITWTAHDSGSDTSSWEGLTYGNGLFVAVADAGTNRVTTSPDGINWTSPHGCSCQ
ncbi:MAG: hypothetical protein WDN27_03860 [Candidatus Saccharibacteria bacterium]